MFDQTFVPAGAAVRPHRVLLSLVIESSAIAGIVVSSLIFTQRLPVAELKIHLVAPQPSAAPLKAKTVSGTTVANRGPRIWVPDFHVRPLASVKSQTASSLPQSAPNVVDGFGYSDDLVSRIANAMPETPKLLPPAPKQAAPVRVGGAVMQANLLHQITPAYPHLAVVQRVEGNVEFSAIIGKAGTIKNLQVIHGHPLLVRSAMDAVLQWRYRPTLLNGSPVEVTTTITVQFHLSQ